MDIFGDTDPTKMPPHFFYRSLKKNYSTAVRADVEKQNYVTCPRHWYFDATYRCVDCNEVFVFSADEQRYWFEELQFFVDAFPVRCLACRQNARQVKQLRQEYDQLVDGVLQPTTDGARKSRVLELLNSMIEAGGQLSAGMLENRRVLQSQLQRRQSDPE